MKSLSTFFNLQYILYIQYIRRTEQKGVKVLTLQNCSCKVNRRCKCNKQATGPWLKNVTCDAIVRSSEIIDFDFKKMIEKFELKSVELLWRFSDRRFLLNNLNCTFFPCCHYDTRKTLIL